MESDSGARAGLDRLELARTAMRALIKMLMIDGFFHADPHPGNIVVLDDNRLALLAGITRLPVRLEILALPTPPPPPRAPTASSGRRPNGRSA